MLTESNEVGVLFNIAILVYLHQADVEHLQFRFDVIPINLLHKVPPWCSMKPKRPHCNVPYLSNSVILAPLEQNSRCVRLRDKQRDISRQRFTLVRRGIQYISNKNLRSIATIQRMSELDLCYY